MEAAAHPGAPELIARRLSALAAIVSLALAMGGGPARATEISSARLAELARRALDDRTALERLLSVDSVDGRRFQARAALAAGTPAELRARLQTLAGSEALAVDSARARSRATAILEQGRYSAATLPRPFEGAVRTLARWLGPVGDLFSWLLRTLLRLSDPSPLGLGAVAAALIGAAAWVVTRVVRGRTSSEVASPGRRGAAADAAELERRAESAENDGDLELAIRLRWRAGLLRLRAGKVIPAGAASTSGEVARRVGPDFGPVAAAFDEIVYGRRDPTPGDLEATRRAWRSAIERGAA